MINELQFKYKNISTPVGFIRLIASPRGVAGIIWERQTPAWTTPLAVLDNQDPLLMEVGNQLTEYFEKKRTAFNLRLDFAGTEFQKKVWNALLNIPFGTTKTYGALARELGDIKAVRAVGGALNKNPIAIVVPCHRIIGASGKLVGFGGGLKNKSILLELESTHRSPKLFNY